MRVSGNPFIVSRILFIFMLFFSSAILLGTILEILELSQGNLADMTVYFPALLAGPISLALLLYAWKLRRTPLLAVKAKVFLIYTLLMIFLALYVYIVKFGDFIFLILALALFSLITATLVISVRTIGSLEKVGPGEYYKVHKKD